MIEDFYELCLPRTNTPDSDGTTKDWGTNASNWDEYTAGNERGRLYWYYLVNDGSLILIDVTEIENENVYFDTEERCHEHAAAYYKKHGKDYPFMIEWIAASGFFAEDKEQVMEFI